MKRARDRAKANYNNKLDKITWEEWLSGSVSTAKQSDKFNINNTIHYILGNRSIISNAGLPTLDTITECRGCGDYISSGEQCLKITLSEGDSLISHVHFCNNCTK